MARLKALRHLLFCHAGKYNPVLQRITVETQNVKSINTGNLNSAKDKVNQLHMDICKLKLTGIEHFQTLFTIQDPKIKQE